MGLFFQLDPDSTLFVFFRRISPDNGHTKVFSKAVSALNSQTSPDKEITGFWYQRETVSRILQFKA